MLLRSVLAIVAGFLFIGLLAVGADALLQRLFPGSIAADGSIDSVPVLLSTLGYVAIFAIAGCYLTARLAPNRPMRHALILGALGLVFNIAGSIAQWNTVPVWYHVVALAMVMPYAYIGGRLREAELRREDSPASVLASPG